MRRAQFLPSTRAVLTALLLLLTGCDSSATAPESEAILVTTRISGQSFDADGYGLWIDARGLGPFDLAASEPISAVPGHHVVELTGLADNCTVRGLNPRTVTVERGAVASATFEVECSYLPRDLAFVSDRSGSDEVYAMGSDGSWPVRLTVDGGEDQGPAWSPHGDRIAFVRAGDSLMVMDAGGSDPLLLHEAGNNLAITEVVWSPDGARIAYTTVVWDDWCPEDAVWTMNADGTAVARLTDGFGPTWSPDGTRLAFTLPRAPCSTGDGDLAVVGIDGSDPVALTDEAGWAAAWSPDGARIAYTSRRYGTEGIYVMNADGSDPTPLTSSGDYDPAWSPDGTRIAFTSERDGNAEIYIMNADGSDLVNLTNNPADDRAPAWGSLEPRGGSPDRRP